ncbi:MAG: glycosyl hydrolase-related protein [Acidobacteriaceae bacterium]
MTPLEMDEVTSQDKAIDSPRLLSGKQASYLEVADPNLVLDTRKPAEDGNGTILRFIDLGGVSRTATVRTPLLDLTQVWLTDAVERNKKRLPLTGTDGFQFTIQPHAIVTVRVVGKDLLP